MTREQQAARLLVKLKQIDDQLEKINITLYKLGVCSPEDAKQINEKITQLQSLRHKLSVARLKLNYTFL